MPLLSPKGRDCALLLFGAFLPIRGIVVEGAMYYGIRLGRSASQAFNILEIASVHIGTRFPKKVCARFRPCKPEHLVPSTEEFRDDG